MSEESDKNGKQVIARAAEVLRALEKSRVGMSLAQLARETDLPRTTVHRIVNALEAQQLVQNAHDGIKLGPALARMAAAAHTDFVTIARPAVEALGRRTRETVDVSVYRNLHAISVDQYASDQELRVVSAVGTAFPAHCTALGKAILAQLPDEFLLKAVSLNLEARTRQTLTTREALLEDIAQTQRRGYALDIEEHARGVCGIGVCFKTGHSDFYAISLAVPALRFEDESASLIAALLKCKAEIDSLL
jgi:IclR family acetate operon transcriptional repressor